MEVSGIGASSICNLLDVINLEPVLLLLLWLLLLSRLLAEITPPGVCIIKTVSGFGALKNTKINQTWNCRSNYNINKHKIRHCYEPVISTIRHHPRDLLSVLLLGMQLYKNIKIDLSIVAVNLQVDCCRGVFCCCLGVFGWLLKRLFGCCQWVFGWLL